MPELARALPDEIEGVRLLKTSYTAATWAADRAKVAGATSDVAPRESRNVAARVLDVIAELPGVDRAIAGADLVHHLGAELTALRPRAGTAAELADEIVRRSTAHGGPVRWHAQTAGGKHTLEAGPVGDHEPTLILVPASRILYVVTGTRRAAVEEGLSKLRG